MIDMNALIAQLQAAGASTETVNQLMASLNNNSAISGQLSLETRANIERAAAAMQVGDYSTAKAAAAQLMSTPDGAQLTSTVLSMLGQS